MNNFTRYILNDASASAKALMYSKYINTEVNVSKNNNYKTYTVKKGDYLWAIAESHGIYIDDLLNIPGNEQFKNNPILIHPNQKVYVPYDNDNHLQIIEKKVSDSEGYQINEMKVIVINYIENFKVKINDASNLDNEDRKYFKKKIDSLNNKIQSSNLSNSEIKELKGCVEVLMNKQINNNEKFLEIINNINNKVEELEDQSIVHESKFVTLDRTLGDSSTNIVKNITYENPLLKHPKLFSQISKIFGLSKAINLSKQLSPELIEQAAASGDIEVLLVGFMSLEVEQ